jgi:hypothetical protein
LPSANETANGTKKQAGVPTSTSTGESGQAAAPARNGPVRDSVNHGAAHPGEGAGSADSAKVESAKAAPLGRLLARVWPAIALGPAGKLLTTLGARLEAATSLPASGLPRLLSGLAGAAGAGGVAGRSAHSATPNSSPGDSTGIPVPGSREISFLVLVILCTALMALLVFAVRRELRAMYRWPF